MTPEQAMLMLKDQVVSLNHRAADSQLVTDAVVAMIGALVETHPDKDALHEAFSRIFQEIGGSVRSVDAMAKGYRGSLAVLAGFSKSIGRELP